MIRCPGDTKRKITGWFVAVSLPPFGREISRVSPFLSVLCLVYISFLSSFNVLTRICLLQSARGGKRFKCILVIERVGATANDSISLETVFLFLASFLSFSFLCGRLMRCYATDKRKSGRRNCN